MTALIGIGPGPLLLHRVIARLGDLRALLPATPFPQVEAEPAFACSREPRPDGRKANGRGGRRTPAQTAALMAELRALRDLPEYSAHGGRVKLAHRVGISAGYLSVLLERL